MAIITGTNGNDSGVNSLQGTEFDDIIDGLAGDDEIFGLDGNDVIDGGQGNDWIEGGAGDDTITDADGDNEIYGGSGNDVIDLRGGDGENFVTPGTGNDTIYGNGSDGTGFTFLSYWGLEFGVTVDLVAGTAVGDGKSDTVSGIDAVRGTDFDDVLLGGAYDGYESFAGMDGSDFIDGRSGYDELIYHLEKGEGSVYVDFETGLATDTYGSVDTFVNMEAVRGSPQDDTLLGADGFQSFRGLDGDDHIDGRGGFDRADYSFDERYGGADGVSVDLSAGTAVDGFGATDTLVNIEWVKGTGSSDSITGDRHDNRLEGLGGNDALDGGGGDDTLIGGGGDDVLMGGTASDTFVFVDGDGFDTIVDFGYFHGAAELPAPPPVGDRIDLSGHSAVNDFSDVIENATQVNDDVLIALGDDTLTLENFDLADLDAGDFIF